MATGGSDDPPDLPEISLQNAGQVPIQEETDHVQSPLGPGSHANTCFVSGQMMHRPTVERVNTDCCEALKTELKKDFETFKTEMADKIKALTDEISHHEIQLQRVELDRDRAHNEAENLREKLRLVERERAVEKVEQQQELQKKNEEIKRLSDLNDKLTKEMETLKEEKEKLQECVNNLTHQVDTLEQKLKNMENHSESMKHEMEDMRAALVANSQRPQCNHQAEIAAAIKASESRLLQRVVTMLSSLDSGGLSIGHLAVVEKLAGGYKSGGSSKSNTAPNTPLSTSPASSDHSSKPPTPPPEDATLDNEQQVPE